MLCGVICGVLGVDLVKCWLLYLLKEVNL